MVVNGNSGPYGFFVSGSIDSGETDPYGEPMTFPQKMKYREASNAFPGPMRGPHLQKKRPKHRILLLEDRSDSPIFNVCAACESMTDNHDVVPPLIEFSPSFISNWDVEQRPARLEREGWDVYGSLTVNNVGKCDHMFQIKAV